MSHPRVSVLLTAHNDGPYLLEAVESVLNQTLTDLELLIIDDGSTDETQAVLGAIDDDRVRVFHQEQQGLGVPVNPWLHEARGEFIMRMDADDRSHPERAARQVAALDEDPDLVLVGCQYQFFTAAGTGPRSRLPTTHDRIVTGLRQGVHTVSHATTTYRRRLVEEGLAYTWSGAGEDWSFLADASRLGRVAVLDDVLYDYRLDPSSSAWRGSLRSVQGLQFARARERARDQGDELPSQEAFMQQRATQRSVTLADRSRALSGTLYRRGVVAGIEDDRRTAAVTKASAALLDPVKTLGWARKQLARFERL